MAPDEDQEVSIGQACRAVPWSGVPCNAMRRVVATVWEDISAYAVSHWAHCACRPYSANCAYG